MMSEYPCCSPSFPRAGNTKRVGYRHPEFQMLTQVLKGHQLSLNCEPSTMCISSKVHLRNCTEDFRVSVKPVPQLSQWTGPSCQVRAVGIFLLRIQHLYGNCYAVIFIRGLDFWEFWIPRRPLRFFTRNFCKMLAT